LKCPKCGYLGFETGDTCKNCGYDFSLIAPAPILTPDPDLAIRSDDPQTGAPELWLDRLDRSMDEVSRPYAKQEHLIGVPESKPATQPDPLPLFNPDDPDDIPLIALPAAPRAPLAVRRNMEPPRLRAVPRSTSAPAASLDFHAEVEGAAEPEEPTPAPRAQREAARSSDQSPAEPVSEVGGRRLIAALIDHTILFGVDAAVIYFTLRMAGLAQSEWLLLPVVPMAFFLGLLKLSYFSAFTAIGGQTIGKMATGIKVIAESGRIDSAVAIRRTLAAALSLLPLGIGFLPALVGPDRRALHDRLTGTRVVGLRSA
jgi:uncharacterized RDD family membrane protein YckC